MDVLINNCAIDFLVEDEKTAKDVAQSLIVWTKERNLIFSEAVINDEYYAIENIPEIPIEEIRTINCIMQSRAELIVSSIYEGIAYCEKAQKFIAQVADKKISALEVAPLPDGLLWLSDVIKMVYELLALDMQKVKYMDYTVDEYISQLELLREKISPPDESDSFIELLSDSRAFLDMIKGVFRMSLMSQNLRDIITKSIDSPDVLIKTLISVKEGLPQTMALLADTALAFQSGHDENGAQNLQQFVDIISQYIRTSYQLEPVFGISLSDIVVDGVTLVEKNNSINSHLNGLIDVMENNDIISLADILEYEMLPVLDNLGLYLDKVIEGVSQTK